MDRSGYRYSARPTRNPLRFLLAVWRATRDLTNTREAALIEMTVSRTRLGRRFARWEEVAATLEGDPDTARALAARERLGPIDLQALGELSPGTLGRVFADHCRARGLDPNLIYIPESNRDEFLLAHLLETHDIWHVATGWGNDETGEVGLGAFYLAQLGLHLFAFLLALILLNTFFFAPTTLRERMDALSEGYQMGKRARPLFGVEWSRLWSLPIEQVRAELGIDPSGVVGEGVRRAA